MARRIALALYGLLISAGLALGADVSTNYVPGPGGYYKPADRSGPYAIGTDGTASLIGAGGSGGAGSGATTVTGSMEQDVRGTTTLNTATLNAAVTVPINGQSSVGFTFTGLTASGATLTYEQSNDNALTWTGVNEVNSGTGVPAATRTTDGQTRLAAQGRTNLRVRVSTVGTGSVTVATNVSVREGIVAIGTPLPPGANLIGSVNLGTLNGVATAANQNVTAAGTSSASAQAVQGVAGGVPQNSYPGQYNAAFPTLASGATAYVALDINGRIIQAPGATVVSSVTAVAVGQTPITSTTSSAVGKASGANLYGYSITQGTTAGFLAILNAAAVPATGTAIAPLECVPVPANGYVARRQTIPDRYAAGIVIVSTSSCATFTAVTPVLMSVLTQ